MTVQVGDVKRQVDSERPHLVNVLGQLAKLIACGADVSAEATIVLLETDFEGTVARPLHTLASSSF